LVESYIGLVAPNQKLPLGKINESILMSLPYSDNVDMLTDTSPAENSVGVVANTTGQGIDVSKRQQIVIQFLGVGSSGSGAFTIDGSNDNVHWTTGLACLDLQSTTPTTFVTSKSVSSTSGGASSAVKVPAGWRFIRANVTVTSAGTYFALLEAAG
jgi:hypothetical protein